MWIGGRTRATDTDRLSEGMVRLHAVGLQLHWFARYVEVVVVVGLIWGQSITAGSLTTPEFLLAWLAGWKSMGRANNSGWCVD